MLFSAYSAFSAVNCRAAVTVDLVRKAEMFYSRGEYAQALVVAEESLDKRLTRLQQAKAYWLVGKSREALGSPDKALSMYQVAVRVYPNDTALLLALGDLFLRVGLEDRSYPHYKAVLSRDPSHLAANIGMGRLRNFQGLYDMAVPHFRKALEAAPDDPAALLGLGMALMGDAKLEEAEKTLRRALKGAGGVETLVALAQVQRRRGAVAEGIETLRQAAVAAPARVDIQLRQASWLMGAGRTEEAGTLLKAVLQADPEDPFALFLQAWAGRRKGAAAAKKDLELVAGQDRSPFLREAAGAILKIQSAR